MPTTITTTEHTITPVLVLGYESEREPGNIIHPILGRANPDVTLRPAGLRTGELQLFFPDETEAAAAEDALAAAGVCELTTSDRASVNMTFVVEGRLARALDPETRDHWTVTVGFQEVTP